MTEPFVGEIQILGFSFAPRNWSLANGALIPIRQSTSLYALYGTQFGGDGVTTFGLPNLATREACGAGQSPGNTQRSIGQTFGTPSVSLTQQQIPMHTHMLNDYQPETVGGLVAIPTATSGIGVDNDSAVFAAPGQSTTMNASAIGAVGSGAPHENRQPYLGLVYAVALSGNYPMFG